MEEAISPVWHLCERDRLSAEVARRIWVSYGGRPWCDEARNDGIVVLLEAMVSRHLTDNLVRASLGLRYLETLAENVCKADYEDTRLLIEEAQWAEKYLVREVQCTLLASSREVVEGELWEHASHRRERLHEALVELAAHELRRAGVAA